jgi:hypothetical protein
MTCLFNTLTLQLIVWPLLPRLQLSQFGGRGGGLDPAQPDNSLLANVHSPAGEGFGSGPGFGGG